MQAVETPGDPYLRFQLFEDTSMLLPMTAVREAIVVSANRLTALPNMSESFIGLLNSRDLVFGVVDLPYALGFTKEGVQTGQYQIIIVRTAPALTHSSQMTEEVLGLAVPKILGITRFDHGDIQPCSDDTPMNLRTLSIGQVSTSQEPLLVMDLQAVTSHLGMT